MVGREPFGIEILAIGAAVRDLVTKVFGLKYERLRKIANKLGKFESDFLSILQGRLRTCLQRRYWQWDELFRIS